MGNQTFQDGHYDFNQVKNALNNEFLSEKEMCDFIELNIEEFTKECLGVDYASHIREYQIGSKRQKGNLRIDFLIKSKCGETFIVECKDPTYKSELSAAVGQVLGYIEGMETFKSLYCKAFIVSTIIDSTLPAIISRFNLPIGFICIDKSKSLVLQNGRK